MCFPGETRQGGPLYILGERHGKTSKEHPKADNTGSARAIALASPSHSKLATKKGWTSPTSPHHLQLYHKDRSPQQVVVLCMMTADPTDKGALPVNGGALFIR